MPQQRFIVAKWVIITILTLSIGIGCKKKDGITPSVVTPESLGLIPIKAGSFTMGSPTGVGDNDEHPQHQVTLSAFYLDTTELTRKEFFPFLQSKDTSYLASDQRSIADYTITGWSEMDIHPIVNVFWFTAVAYCNWLTKQTGSKDTCYTFTFNGNGTINTVSLDRNKKGYRLPTEAEWEYACRAETTTPYSFTDETKIGDYAWYSTNSSNTTHAVGGKKPNPFGLYDMHGNVWEWTGDWYPAGSPYYPSGAETNPTGATTGSSRVVRGGSWGNNAVNLRSANRSYDSPGFRYDVIGFRLAKTM